MNVMHLKFKQRKTFKKKKKQQRERERGGQRKEAKPCASAKSTYLKGWISYNQINFQFFVQEIKLKTFTAIYKSDRHKI